MRSPVIIFVLLSVIISAPAAVASTSAERAEELFLEGEYDKAISEADKAIDADSGKRYELYYLKGLSALKLKKFAEARKAFEYVTQRYPRSGRGLDSYVGIGDAYFLEGNTQGALRSYKMAADIFPDDKNIIVVRQRISECMTKTVANEKPKEYAQSRPAEKRQGLVNFVPKQKRSISIDAPEQAMVATGGGYYCVQVGSFKNRSNASKLASKLSAKNYEARVESPAASSDKLYRVKVGHLSLREDAEKLAAKLKRAGYPTRVCQEN